MSPTHSSWKHWAQPSWQPWTLPNVLWLAWATSSPLIFIPVLMAISPCTIPGNSPREGTGVNGKLTFRDCNTTLHPNSHHIIPAWVPLSTRGMVFHALDQQQSHWSLKFVWRAGTWCFPLMFFSGGPPWAYHKLSDGPVMVETWTHPERKASKNWKSLTVWLKQRKGSKSILKCLVYEDFAMSQGRQSK